MSVQRAIVEFDALILSKSGNLSEALESEDGQSILRGLLASENRSELREWYRPTMELNSLANELKEILEKKLGERL